MTLYFVVNGLKMLYVLFYYVSSTFVFLCHLLWFLCLLASSGIPWLTLLLIIICIGSKFVKLKCPNGKCIVNLLGDPHSVETANGLFWPVAHRGAYFDVPENSAASVKKCCDQTCNMILLDLEMTKCGELLILHKSTLEKANITQPISNITFDSLQNLSISDNHPLSTQYPPEKILSLANLVTILENIDLTVFLLVSTKNPKCINAIKLAIKSNNLLSKKIIFCSSSVYVLYQLRKACPDLICGLWMNKLTECGIQFLFRNSTLLTSICGAIYRNILVPVIGISVVFLYKDEYNAHIQSLWKNVGVRPIVYYVNSPNEKRYFQKVMKTQYLTDSLRSEPQILVKNTKKINDSF